MALLEIIREREERLRAFREDALKEAKRLASLLRERYDYEALFLHGSILTNKFRMNSDIDMVIKGLRVEDFFKAYALLLRESQYKIDLKPFEELDETFQKGLQTKGLKIG